MSRAKRFLAVLCGVLALGAVVALPASPASANFECPRIPFEPTPECPGEEPPPPEEPSDGMWTPPPPVDMPMMTPVVSSATDDCWLGLRPFQDIYATDTGQVAYTFEIDLDICIDKRTGLITLFEHFPIGPDWADNRPMDPRVVVIAGPILLQNESTPIARGAQAPAGRFRYSVTVQFRPTPDSPVQTYVHRLGVLLTTNPRQGRLLSEFFRSFP